MSFGMISSVAQQLRGDVSSGERTQPTAVLTAPALPSLNLATASSSASSALATTNSAIETLSSTHERYLAAPHAALSGDVQGVDADTLPPPRWFESRAVGRSIGVGLFATAVAALGYAAFRTSSSELARLFVGGLGVGAGGVGYWLVSVRRYLRDPEAVREYVAEFMRVPLPEGFVNLRWDVLYLTELVGSEALRARVRQDLASAPKGLAVIWKRYGGERVVGPLLLYKIVTREFILEQFALDRASPSESGALVACIALYGPWLVKTVRVDSKSISESIDVDVGSRGLTWDQLIALKVKALFSAQLVSRPFLQAPLIQFIQSRGLRATLELEEAWWLGDGDIAVLAPEHIAPFVRQTLVASADIATDVTGSFSSLISQYGNRIGLSEAERLFLAEVQRQWERLSKEITERDLRDDERCTKEVERISHEKTFIANTPTPVTNSKYQNTANNNAVRLSDLNRQEQKIRDDTADRKQRRKDRLASIQSAIQSNWQRIITGQSVNPIDYSLEEGSSVYGGQAQGSSSASSSKSVSKSNVEVNAPVNVNVLLQSPQYYAPQHNNVAMNNINNTNVMNGMNGAVPMPMPSAPVYTNQPMMQPQYNQYPNQQLPYQMQPQMQQGLSQPQIQYPQQQQFQPPQLMTQVGSAPFALQPLAPLTPSGPYASPVDTVPATAHSLAPSAPPADFS